MTAIDSLLRERFPRASKYSDAWVKSAVSGAANPLWMTEWLSEALDLTPGMRVLDLGCGRGVSSIFLCREFGVQVWAADLWFSASERLERIKDAGVEDGVFSIQADARSLPFADGFFDVVVSIDSFFYYGTDDLYLNYLARFVKPGGQLGIAGAGVMQEIDAAVPEHLRGWWTSDMVCLHSSAWWRHHWSRSGLVDVERADALNEGWTYWRDWLKAIAADNATEIATVETDAGRYLGYVRAVARFRAGVELMNPNLRVPARYEKRPLLRS